MVRTLTHIGAKPNYIRVQHFLKPLASVDDRVDFLGKPFPSPSAALGHAFVPVVGFKIIIVCEGSSLTGRLSRLDKLSVSVLECVLSDLAGNCRSIAFKACFGNREKTWTFHVCVMSRGHVPFL